MALFLQLRLLLWKNCVYRRRQKFRFAVELMWPLCLFLLLMWVRTKGFHKTMHQCHFEEKPLPSSGQLLFFQGALCAFNNTCHEYPTQANREQSSKTPSKFNEILEDAKAYAETMVTGDKTKLNNFASNIGYLAEELSKIHLEGGNETYMDQNLTKNSIGRIVKLHHELDQSIQEIKPVVKLIGLLDKIYNNYDNLTELIKEAPFLDEFFIRLHTYVCGNNTKITLDMLLDSKNECYGFDYFLDINKFPTTLHYEYDEESSELCNELYEKLETTPSLKIVWRIMKPFVKGKIVYSPNTTVVRRIVDRVRNLMKPLSLPNFDAERESLSMDPIVYVQVVKNIKLIKDYLQTMNKLKNSENINYLLQQGFHESVFKAEEIIERYNEKYRNIGKGNITLLEILQCYNQRDFEGYSTEREAEERSMALCDKNDLLAQINFENANENNLSSLVSYKIRLNSERMPHPTELGKFSLNSRPRYRPMNDLKLITFGFIYIQDLFEKSIITELTGREITPGIVLKQFPHPCYIEDWFMSSLSDMFPLFMVLSWVYTSSMIVKSIVHEKEQKLKETMCVLGLNNTIYWCSWFIDSFIPMSVTVCLLSVILVYGGILANADLTLVMVFLILFAVATINQSFLLSVCFSKANQAASSSGVIYFITYLPFPFIEQWYPHFAPVTKLFACSLSNVALGLGSRYFSMRESEGAGCKWINVAESPVPGDRFNLLIIMFILVFDSTIYLLLAWYVENVFPGSYGMPKPWYFPFKKSYWCNPSVDLLEEESDSRNTSLDEKLKKDRLENHFETIPEQLRISVSISNLSKTYKNNVTAISNLNINFYEDQITAFLGRNGAGKTTTISILTGLFPPTSGTAKIYGQDVRTNITSIRQNLGICPQYNLYFNCFTVEEHLWFFARLKGHSPGEAQVEIQQILQDLGLSNKKQCLASYLSGGMKRKLSVAIAFIGGSRTVILDEPTAGVDPYSRIGIWDLIQKNKKGRTIILTTHMMSEAELLGDRIAIFANGDLLCCGSSSFLKSNFGWGIVLTVDFSRMNNKEDEAKVKELTEAINSIIPSSNVIDTFGTEIKFNLPKVDGNVENYNKLFSYLEENRSYLGINTYGIADTSLEEIFMKMVGEHDKKDGNFNENDQVNELKLTNFRRFEKEKPKNRYLRQFTALLHKRLHHFKRSKLILGVELILPIVFVCVCMLVTRKLPNVRHPRAYVVDISNCTNCTSFFEIIPETSSELIKRYVQYLTDPIGIGIKCIGDNITRQSSCSDISLKKDNLTLSKKIYSDCTCQAGSISCTKNATYGTLPFFVLGSGHKIINVTDINVTKWILNSWKQYGSIRTGGYSFGLKLPTKSMSLSTIFDDIKKEKQKNMDIIKDDDSSLSDNIVIWYNNKWSLSPVVYLNGINNVILRASVPEDESHKFGIILTVHAMNYTPAQFQSEIMLTGAAALLHSVSLIFSLSFIPTAFILYLIEERITNSKHLQFLSGVNWMVYWIQALIWDMLCYFIATLFCIIGLMIFGTEMYVNKTSFPCLFILILLYGWANIPFMYPASFFFQVSSSAFVTLSCVNLLIGLTTTATTYVLRILKDEYLSAIEITLRKVLLIFPHFCLGDGVMKLAEMYLLTTGLSKYRLQAKKLYSSESDLFRGEQRAVFRSLGIERRW
ncbi:phospholipid-transporting ATPase ABCA1-like isoform X2 [Rhodnius prolixus]|uniref:phospholipid-transporting ATPase ABCA1-like isoform X2 n=1 Tax=Rhodnius prolixus TaxID=13249 RepID=UPI003D189588